MNIPDMSKFSETNLSDNLKKLRNSKSISQAEMARMLGLARTTYTSYESGKSTPSLQILLALSEFFNVSINYMCLNNGDNFNKDKNKDYDVSIFDTKKNPPEYTMREELEQLKAKVKVLEDFIKDSISVMMENVKKSKDENKIKETK